VIRPAGQPQSSTRARHATPLLAPSAFIALAGCAIVPPRRNNIARVGSRSSLPPMRSGTLYITAVRSMTFVAAAKLSSDSALYRRLPVASHDNNKPFPGPRCLTVFPIRSCLPCYPARSMA
jgi:hypothetical protein